LAASFFGSGLTRGLFLGGTLGLFFLSLATCFGFGLAA